MMDRRTLILLAAGGSAALLAGAHIFEALGYAPCKLCLWQRGPHWAAVAIGVAALLVPGRVLPMAGALAAAATGLLGLYHTGVEQRWWPGPDACTSGGSLAGSADDLLDAIMAAPLVRCDEVAWSLFGISMASWNALLSFALMTLWVAAARRVR